MLKLSVRITNPTGGLTIPPDDHPEGNIWRDAEGRIVAWLFRDSGRTGICFPGSASYIFPEDLHTAVGLELHVVPQGTLTTDQLVDQIIRHIVPLILQSRDFQVFHASAIRFREGVVAFSGASFAGKSTLAYALSTRGYEVWADDSLLVGITNGDVQAFKGTSARLRLRSDSREYFGGRNLELARADGLADFEFDLGVPSKAPLRHLFFINRVQGCIQGKLWSCERMEGARAFSKALEQAMYFDLASARERRRIAETCLIVASKVPVYNCCYRQGFDLLEQVVDEVESFFRTTEPSSDAWADPTFQIQ